MEGLSERSRDQSCLRSRKNVAEIRKKTPAETAGLFEPAPQTLASLTCDSGQLLPISEGGLPLDAPAPVPARGDLGIALVARFESAANPVPWRFGVPVIATNVGGTSELVEDGRTGLLIRPSDIHALVDAVVRMIDDYEFRKQAAERGRKKVEEEFDVEKETEKLRTCFLE